MDVKVLCLVTFLLITSSVDGRPPVGLYRLYFYTHEGVFRCIIVIIETVESSDTDTVSRLFPSASRDDGRRKRSTEMVDESGDTYINGTAEDFLTMFNTFDGNCDGLIDVTEWSKLAPVEQFIDLLKGSDADGDTRISLMELESKPLRLYPEKEFMFMPMNMFEEMTGATDSSQEGDTEGKGRKGAE